MTSGYAVLVMSKGIIVYCSHQSTAVENAEALQQAIASHPQTDIMRYYSDDKNELPAVVGRG